MDNTSSKYWVVPFGNPRINGHLHLHAAYRSLSRPSSPPRAKASAMCPYFISSTLFVLHDCNTKENILSAVNHLEMLSLKHGWLCSICFYFFACYNMSNNSLGMYDTLFKASTSLKWRITDSNRWPPACKAGALASWANPPIKLKIENEKLIFNS